MSAGVSRSYPGDQGLLAASPPRRRSSLVLPLLLIGLGLVFLLQNLGVLRWDIWGALARLWPLLLVAFGLELLLGRRVGGLVLGVALAGVVLAGTRAFAPFGWLPAAATPGRVSQTSFSHELRGATEGAVEVQFGAGRLTVGALEPRTRDQLASMAYEGPEGRRPSAEYRRRGSVGELVYAVQGDGPRHAFPFLPGAGDPARMDVRLAPGVPLTLDVRAGAADSRLDLSKLRLSRLSLQTGASTTELVLPEAAGTTTAIVSGGASTLTIVVPENVAAQIRFDGGVSALDVDESRFPAVEDLSDGRRGRGGQRYRSPNYDSAQNRVDLRIEVGAATVTVR